MTEQLDDIHTGDLAESWNVQRLVDLVKGVFGYPVSFTRHAGLEPTLRLRNLVLGAPVLEIVGANWPGDGSDPILQITEQGVTQQLIGGYLDFTYQDSTVPGPGAGSEMLRLYSRDGQLYFKAEGSSEQQIPSVAPGGPTATLRYGFWQGTP